MNFRLGLSLAAIAMMIAAIAVATSAAGLDSMRSRFKSVAQATAASSPGSAAAVASSYYKPSRFGSYNYAEPYKVPSGEAAPEQPLYESLDDDDDDESDDGTEVDGYAPYAPRFHLPVEVHPPLPRVAPRRSPYGSRFNAGGVSTFAAAGAGGAAAGSVASAGGSGPSSLADAVAAVADDEPSGNSSSSAGFATSASSSPDGYEEHNVETEETSEHYSEPETVSEYGAQAGAYADDGRGLITRSYVRSTDVEETHEDGKEDSDHYYNAGSYGKTYDENNSESFDNEDEDILHTKNLYRSTRSKTAYQKEASKTRRESGSRVLAKDRHSAAYNKDLKKFKENVDEHFHKEGEGVFEAGQSSESSDFEEESEEARDSRNLGNFVGVDGVRHAQRPAFNPAAAAAAAASAGAAGTNSTAIAGSL